MMKFARGSSARSPAFVLLAPASRAQRFCSYARGNDATVHRCAAKLCGKFEQIKFYTSVRRKSPRFSRLFYFKLKHPT
jgi:hypothetical protein